MTFGLVLLTLNEIKGLSALFNKIPINEFDEVFAVDGGSNDGTIDFFRNKNIKIVSQSSKGRGEAFRLASENSNSDVLIFFSPDGNENPADIINIKKQFVLNENIDMCIASRMMKGAYNEEDDNVIKPRKWANNMFNLLANIFFNRNLFNSYITDSINGFRAIKRSSFNKLNTDATGFTIEYQMTIRAMKNKYLIVEIPTIEGHRIGGISKAKSIPTGLRFLYCLFKEIVCR